MRKLLLGALSLLMLAQNVNAKLLGYAIEKEKYSPTNCYRLGTGTTQGQAIRLSKAKLEHLKGKTIDFAEFFLGSNKTTDKKIHAFITTALNGTPIAEADVTISTTLKALKWTLDKPYVITGEEENLYIGYTTKVDDTTRTPLVGDGSYDIEGCTFAYGDNGWEDTYSKSRGSAPIFINIAEGFDDYADVSMGKINFNNYYKVGVNYDLSARFINTGTKTITSFDAEIEINGKKSTQSFTNLNIGAKAAYSFNLNGLSTNEEGTKTVRVNVTNVNGNNDDIDPSDNEVAGSMFFYPSYMERSLLMETFTGTTCPNCPSGHTNEQLAISKSTEDIINVTHHIGYYPDPFTMKEDQQYLFFYSSSQGTFAPALMVNRNTNTDIATAPVVEATGNTQAAAVSKISKLFTLAAETKPYVSLNLETNFDETTRKLEVKLQIKPNEELPVDSALFNVVMVQDSLPYYQSNGGNNYMHNRVHRGSITGNAWGFLIRDLKVGTAYNWTKTITLPDSIYSDYWTDSLLQANKFTKKEVTWKAIPKNMSVVAYIGQYNPIYNTRNIIYNAVEAKMGESHMQWGFDYTTGIENNKQEQLPLVDIRIVNGKVSVDGSYDKLYVYSITGKMVDPSAQLAKGAYIVKVVNGSHQTTKKVLVR